MAIAKKIYKYVFPWVNVKFSGFPLLLGAAVAYVYGFVRPALPYGRWCPWWVVLIIVFIADIIGEGVWQHGHDILNDKTGGVSGFREEGPLAERIARGMVIAAGVAAAAVSAFVVAAGRPWLIPSGIAALYLAWKYSKKRNEGYAMASVAIATAAGYFTLTYVPSIPLAIAVCIAVFEHKAALAFYRYDDYAGIKTKAEFPDPMQRLKYFREIFWLVMWVSWLVTLLLIYNVIGGWVSLGLVPVAVGIAQKWRVICHEGK